MSKKIIVPDEAISYIVERYLSNKKTSSVDFTVGIRSDVVEDVVSLFLNWADSKDMFKGLESLNGDSEE